MKYLIDTHVVIWFLEGSINIPEKTRLIITDPNNEIFVSIATFWEMAIKMSLGKLILPKELKKIIEDNKSCICPEKYDFILQYLLINPLEKTLDSKNLNEKNLSKMVM